MESGKNSTRREQKILVKTLHMVPLDLRLVTSSKQAFQIKNSQVSSTSS